MLGKKVDVQGTSKPDHVVSTIGPFLFLRVQACARVLASGKLFFKMHVEGVPQIE